MPKSNEKQKQNNNNKYEPYFIKKKISDKLKGGLENPPAYIKTLMPESGKLSFCCNGKSSNNHKITISVESNKLIYSCDCKCDSNLQTESCTHINTTVIKICLDYIENCIKFNQNKQATLEIKNDLNDIIHKLDDFKF